MFTAVDVERCYNFDLKRWAHINHGFQTFKNPYFTKTDEGILGFCMPWWEGREENIGLQDAHSSAGRSRDSEG